MEFWRTILVLLRRWRVSLPILLVSLAVGGAVFTVTPRQYTSNAIVVLTPPTGGGTLSQDPAHPNGVTNPLLSFDFGLKTTASILVQVMNTAEFTAQLAPPSGAATKLTVTDGSTNPLLLGSNGPFIQIAAESTSAVAARDVVVRTVQHARDELVSRQKAVNAPPSTFVTITDVVPPSTPVGSSTTRLQLTLAGLIASFIGGMGIYYVRHRTTMGRRQSAKEALGPPRVPITPPVAARIAAPAVNGSVPPPVARTAGADARISASAAPRVAPPSRPRPRPSPASPPREVATAPAPNGVPAVSTPRPAPTSSPRSSALSQPEHGSTGAR